MHIDQLASSSGTVPGEELATPPPLSETHAGLSNNTHIRIEMAYVLLFAIVAVMLGGSFMNFQTGQMTEALSLGFMGLGILFFSCIFLFFIVPARRGKSKDPLLGWILDNKTVLENGGSADYRGHPIRRDTPLIRYCWVLSVVTLSIKSPGKWMASDTGRSNLTRVLSTLFNLLFGWWGIPWGPIFTVQSLLINLGGQWRMSVSDVLSGDYEVERHQ
jgi:hypothetical protein